MVLRLGSGQRKLELSLSLVISWAAGKKSQVAVAGLSRKCKNTNSAKSNKKMQKVQKYRSTKVLKVQKVRHLMYFPSLKSVNAGIYLSIVMNV